MWTLENTDTVINQLKTKVGPEAFVGTALRFSAFVAKVDAHHPCAMPFPVTSRLTFSKGHDFAIHLPGGWWITYRVLPDCSVNEGIVRFIEVNRMGSVASSQSDAIDQSTPQD